MTIPAGFVRVSPPQSESNNSTLPEGFVRVDPPKLNNEIATPSFDGSPVVEKVLQGATLGFSDEIQSAGRAAVDKVGGLINGEPVDFSDRYNQYQEDYRNYFDQYDKENPALGMAAEIAGSIPTAGGCGGQGNF